MFLLDYRKLAGDLAAGRITELDSLKYYAVGTAMTLVNQQLAVFGANSTTALFALDCLIMSFALFFGISHCWEKNGGKAGSNFVLRMICLSVPASIRLMLLWLAIYALQLFSHDFFYGGSFSNPYRAQVIFSYGAFIAMNIYFWNMMGRAMRIAAGHPATTVE